EPLADGRGCGSSHAESARAFRLRGDLCMSKLAQHNIVVTGAGSGIGRAIAMRLAEEGAHVGVLDRDEGAARRVATELASARGRPTAVAMTGYAAVGAALAEFERERGPISGLVNCAGWDRFVNFVDSTPDLWRQVVDINLIGTLNVLHHVLRSMAARGAGRIV